MSQADAIILRRPRPPRALISLVAMIDVLLILLVFFMVTSTYLDLDMIPAVSQDENTASTAPLPDQRSRPLMIRIGADGRPFVRGQPLDDQMLAARVRDANGAPVLILPTGVAQTQSLVTVMDIATRAGAREVRVIRLEARP
ncbi:Biopolymer transport protein, ExbD/TolR family [Sulfitobacter noctilucae]|uniref:ExbD/TolR family protein n=1 Tax=Sulfitobacter noctilucae TaxID=1342302 RepID=UPI000A8590C4|nr:biopolymer transporter ExbD [Sulfitobacter noctilucae]KIN70283.1 Biopolymer transport protein, ExbD/TolR family [Sulfitobacter noctilucae]